MLIQQISSSEHIISIIYNKNYISKTVVFFLADGLSLEIYVTLNSQKVKNF
jgi:hypothetical protein